MKELLANFVNYLGRLSIFNHFFSGVATIVMLHRVYPFERGKLHSNEAMKVSPEFLERFIQQSIEDGYQFISLNKLYDILEKKQKITKRIVITLDDGYRDNFEVAYPIFKKYGVPFCIYVTTSFPEKTAVLWWYAIEDLIVQNETIKLSTGEVYGCKTIKDKEDVFLQIRKKILSLDASSILDELKKMFSNYDIDWLQKSNKLSMSWDQIIELSKDNLATIGGHTVNHLAFNKLSEDEIYKEILEGNDLISSKIGKRIEHFSYPFGSVNEVGSREFKILSKMNFKTATTTRRGNIFMRQRYKMEQFPRVMLTERMNLNKITASLLKDNILRQFRFIFNKQ